MSETTEKKTFSWVDVGKDVPRDHHMAFSCEDNMDGTYSNFTYCKFVPPGSNSYCKTCNMTSLRSTTPMKWKNPKQKDEDESTRIRNYIITKVKPFTYEPAESM